MFGSCLVIISFLFRRLHSLLFSLLDEMKKSRDSPPPPSFSSLPEDVALNCLARVPRFYRPTLSLVSRDFRSLIASPELEATRSRIGITEDYLCVCLNLNKNKPDSRWFTLSPIPQQQILKPMPWIPYQDPEFSTVLCIGSEIYIIGGFVNGRRSRRVLILDCRSHQCRSLPDMRKTRVSAAADVIDGKMYVIGGSRSNNIEDWGEVYDPKSQTWEPLLPTTIDLTTQKSVVPGKLVMGGKVYDMDESSELQLEGDICLVKIDFMMYQTSVRHGMLFWYDPEEDLGWSRVKGLEGLHDSHFLCYLISVANYDGGRRVTVWWNSVVFGFQGDNWIKECKTEIWCAEISLERRSLGGLWGTVEWSNIVFTFDGCDSPCDFFSHSAIVTY